MQKLNWKSLLLVGGVAAIGAVILVGAVASTVRLPILGWHGMGSFIVLLVLTVLSGRFTVPVTNVDGTSQTHKSVADAFIFLAVMMYTTAPANSIGPALILAAIVGFISSFSRSERWPTVFAVGTSIISTFVATLVYRFMVLTLAGAAGEGNETASVLNLLLFPLCVFGFVQYSLSTFSTIAFNSFHAGGRVTVSKESLIWTLITQVANVTSAALFYSAIHGGGLPFLFVGALIIVLVHLLYRFNEKRVGEVTRAQVDKIRYAEEIARDFDPESQVKAMDKEGLDLAILYPTAGMYATAFTHMDPRFAAAVCRAYNNWLYDYIRAADPKRLFGAACVSPHDIAGAVAETRRAVLELGMKAIFLRPNIYNDKPWHDPFYDPLWAACQELNVPVGFHETTGSRMKAAGTDRFQALGIAHISTHPMEQMLACMDIIMGGVMERFPRLRCAFLEANCGWLPFWLGRMDEHYEWREPYGEMTHLAAKPSEYFRRQGFCAAETPPVLSVRPARPLQSTATAAPPAKARFPAAPRRLDRLLRHLLVERP